MEIYSHTPKGDIAARHFVVLNSDETVSTAAASLAPYGVNELAAVNGAITDVVLAGLAKVSLGDAVSAGQELKSDANGKAIACTSSEHTGIFARQSGTSGQIIEAFIR